MIYRNEDTSSLIIIGGKSTNDSAFLQAYGKNNYLYPGVFTLNANIGNGVKSLIGYPDGTLTWNNNDLTGTAIKGKSLNNNGYISYASGLIIQYVEKTTVLHNGFQDIYLSINFLNSFVYTVNFKNDAYIPKNLNQNLSTLEFIPIKISDGTEIYTGTYQVFYIAIGS